MSSPLGTQLLPSGAVLHHRVENRERLAHARDQGHLVGFPGCPEALIELADHRIRLPCGKGGHVQGRPDGRAAVSQVQSTVAFSIWYGRRVSNPNGFATA